MIRQDTRLLAVLAVFLVFLVTWLVMAGEFQQRSYRTTRLEDYPKPKIEPTEEPTPERRRIMVATWLRDLLEEAGISVASETTDEDKKPERGCILHGKLIWENKPWLPLKGVEVRVTDAWLDTIMPTKKREATDPLLLPPKATTDKAGKFILRDVPTRETLFLVVRDQRRTLMVKKLRHLPRPGQMLNLYEVEVPEQGTLRGRVADDEDQALAGITVRAVSDPLNRGPLRDERLEIERVENARFFRARGQIGASAVPRWVSKRDRLLPFPSTVTANDGTFLLRGVRAGPTVLMAHGRHGATLRKADVAANETTDIGTVVATQGASLKGYVANEGGHAIASAQVTIQPNGLPFTMDPVTTDTKGHFDCGYIPGDDHRVLVKTEESQLWRTASPEDDPRRHPWANGETVYEVARGLTGMVTVVDPTGRPVTDAEASLSHLDSALTRTWLKLPRHLTAMERPGRFVLHGLPRGKTFRLVVAAPDHAPAVMGFTVQPRKGPFQAGGIQVQLRPTFPIRFVVRGVNDQPVAGASVSMKFQPPRDRPPGTDDGLLTSGDGALLGHTDENGVLETPQLWATPAWFAAFHPDYGLTPTQLVHPRPGMVIPIWLRLTGRVSGKLTLQGEPPGSRWVIRARPAMYFTTSVEKSPFLKPYRTITAPDGSFYFNDLFEGTCNLSLHRLAADPGFPTVFAWPEGEQSEVVVVAGMTVLHEWDVPQDRQARFHITGTAQVDGRPLPHAVLRILVTLEVSSLQSFLVARHRALYRARERVRKKDRDESELNERMWSISSLYREMERTKKVPPAEHFPKDILAAIKKPFVAFKADAQGRFDIALRGPGTYQLRLADSQGKQELARALTTWTKPRHKDDGTRRAEVHFNVQTGSLRLTLTTHETVRIRRRAIRLTQEPPGAIFRLRTDDQGDVFVHRIPAGKYRLSIDGPGAGEAELRNPIVNITAGTLNFHNAYTNPHAKPAGRRTSSARR